MQHAIKWHLSHNRSEAEYRVPHGVLSLLGHVLTAGDMGKLVCTAISLINSFLLFLFFFFLCLFLFFFDVV